MSWLDSRLLKPQRREERKDRARISDPNEKRNLCGLCAFAVPRLLKERHRHVRTGPANLLDSLAPSPSHAGRSGFHGHSHQPVFPRQRRDEIAEGCQRNRSDSREAVLKKSLRLLFGRVDNPKLAEMRGTGNNVA